MLLNQLTIYDQKYCNCRGFICNNGLSVSKAKLSYWNLPDRWEMADYTYKQGQIYLGTLNNWLLTAQNGFSDWPCILRLKILGDQGMSQNMQLTAHRKWSGWCNYNLLGDVPVVTAANGEC